MKKRYAHHPHQRSKKRDEFTEEEVQRLTALFHEKNAYLSFRFRQLTPKEFYRGLFPVGSFEHYNGNEGDDPTKRKGNGIVSVVADADRRGWSYNRILFDDLAALDEVAGKEFVYIGPVSYSGRRRDSKKASRFYGLTIDLDGVDDLQCIEDLIHQMQIKFIPYATYLVNSGQGLHLYYVFDTPLPAKPKFCPSFSKLKETLSGMVWNAYTSRRKDKEVQGIFQAYRAPGSQTKFSADCLVTAFEIGKPVSLNYLNSFVDPEEQADFDEDHYTSLDEAAELWPEWYERRQKQPVGNYQLTEAQRKRRRSWYDAWIRRIKKGAVDGNRYYCVAVLFNYAMKAGIDIEEATQDALDLVYYLDSLTTKPGNRFTEKDVMDARGYYDKKYIKLGRNGIKRMTQIDIGITKRNGKTQKDHLRRQRLLQNDDDPEGTWRNKEGRPTKLSLITRWRESHPNGRKIDCERDLQISRHTVLKWWDDAGQPTLSNARTISDIPTLQDLTRDN